MNFLKKVFDHEYKELEKFKALAKQVVALDEEMTALSDDQLKEKTAEFQERIAHGETLEDVKIEAFAVAREAAYHPPPYHATIPNTLHLPEQKKRWYYEYFH